MSQNKNFLPYHHWFAPNHHRQRPTHPGHQLMWHRLDDSHHLHHLENDRQGLGKGRCISGNDNMVYLQTIGDTKPGLVTIWNTGKVTGKAL